MTTAAAAMMFLRSGARVLLRAAPESLVAGPAETTTAITRTSQETKKMLKLPVPTQAWRVVAESLAPPSGLPAGMVARALSTSAAARGGASGAAARAAGGSGDGFAAGKISTFPTQRRRMGGQRDVGDVYTAEHRAKAVRMAGPLGRAYTTYRFQRSLGYVVPEPRELSQLHTSKMLC